MKKTLLIGPAFLVISAAMGQAQEVPPPPPPPHGGPMMHGPGGPPRDGFEVRPVTGAPFSAQFVSTSTQTLSDGSHISRNVNATVARDSQGRTYRQQTMDNLGPVPTNGSKTVIFIHDPVSHTAHVISSDAKTDMVSHMRGGRGPHTENGTAPQAAGPRPEMRAPRARKNDTVENLPAQMIEGVWAEGTRVTHTIPAGTIGNEKDLKVVSETWYSKDLQMVVMSKHTDPRMGESTFRVMNIQRAEPDATLFQTPAGFKVTEHGRPPR
ncbi:MAG TPA: hypothetical protein VGL72_18050 [Bryobacteraceae bacterium]|jgi:hypothetical protein